MKQKFQAENLSMDESVILQQICGLGPWCNQMVVGEGKGKMGFSKIGLGKTLRPCMEGYDG